jgi:CheY-like chemotaxis protein
MAAHLRSAKHLLVISDDADHAARTARMLDELGYQIEMAEPGAVVPRCREQAPRAAIFAATDEEAGALHDALRELKRLQDLGELPSFPIVAAGALDGMAAENVVDGIVLEPQRMTSLATEISKQVDGVPTPAPLPMTVEDEDS